jgi:hypothetical protein
VGIVALATIAVACNGADFGEAAVRCSTPLGSQFLNDSGEAGAAIPGDARGPTHPF